MLSLKGSIKGESVVLENDDIKKYDGMNVIITILNSSTYNLDKNILLRDELVHPTMRGTNVDSYIEELR